MTDAGFRLSVVISNLYGTSARAMIMVLLNGETPEQLLTHADSRLKATPDELREALDGGHRFVIRELMAHITELEACILRFRQILLSSLSAYQAILQNLQTTGYGVFVDPTRLLLTGADTDYKVLTVQRNAPRWIKSAFNTAISAPDGGRY